MNREAEQPAPTGVGSGDWLGSRIVILWYYYLWRSLDGNIGSTAWAWLIGNSVNRSDSAHSLHSPTLFPRTARSHRSFDNGRVNDLGAKSIEDSLVILISEAASLLDILDIPAGVALECNICARLSWN